MIDHILCITLPHRMDRHAQAQAEFERAGIPALFVQGMYADDGRIGLMKALVNVFIAHDGNIMVFEDDVQFTVNVKNVLGQALSELPDEWDMLYLGANLCKPTAPYSPHLVRIRGALAAHAVLYNRRMVPEYLAHLNRVVAQGYVADQSDISDVFLTTIQERGMTYLTVPTLATQRPGWSDIEKREVNYTDIL